MKIVKNVRKNISDAYTRSTVFTASTFGQRAMLNESARKCSVLNVAQILQGIRIVKCRNSRTAFSECHRAAFYRTVTRQLFKALTVTRQLPVSKCLPKFLTNYLFADTTSQTDGRTDGRTKVVPTQDIPCFTSKGTRSNQSHDRRVSNTNTVSCRTGILCSNTLSRLSVGPLS